MEQLLPADDIVIEKKLCGNNQLQIRSFEEGSPNDDSRNAN
jgi:hypothetical protein